MTTLRPVPPGTNGAISLLGTTVSLLGGTSLGVLFWTIDGRLRTDEGLGKWAVLGGLAGLGGSLLDSVLGSSLQRTYYDRNSRKILLHNPVVDKNREKENKREEKELEVVAGWDVLTNNQVNLISSAVVSGVMAWMAWSGVV